MKYLNSFLMENAIIKIQRNGKICEMSDKNGTLYRILHY